MPVESTETRRPRRFLGEGAAPRFQAGPVRDRRGTGQTMEVAAKGDLEFAVNATFDRVANAPRGREGGTDGPPAWLAEVRREAAHQGLPGDTENGDRLILKLPGGAGMGDPTARDPAFVARDVRDGLVPVGDRPRALQSRCHRRRHA